MTTRIFSNPRGDAFARLIRRALLAPLLATLGVLAASPSGAQTAPPYGSKDWATTREALFEGLKTAGSELEAQKIANLIWLFWFQGPDEETNQLMAQAMERRGVYDYAGAIEILDKIVERRPDYAEGWNQRATVLFLQDKYDRSLDDVERVLALEPKHFGALSGKALILMRQGRMALGQAALRQALEIHPYLQERSMLLPDTSQDL